MKKSFLCDLECAESDTRGETKSDHVDSESTGHETSLYFLPTYQHLSTAQGRARIPLIRMREYDTNDRLSKEDNNNVMFAIMSTNPTHCDNAIEEYNIETSYGC